MTCSRSDTGALDLTVCEQLCRGFCINIEGACTRAGTRGSGSSTTEAAACDAGMSTLNASIIWHVGEGVLYVAIFPPCVIAVAKFPARTWIIQRIDDDAFIDAAGNCFSRSRILRIDKQNIACCLHRF
jgi:hypothetical protein